MVARGGCGDGVARDQRAGERVGVVPMSELRRERGWWTSGAYVLELTDSERDSLAWIADRYCSASVLFDGARWEQRDDEIWAGVISSGVMWGYLAALIALEDYDAPPPSIPPCAGGTLADKLRELVRAFPTDLEFRDQ